MYPAPMNLGVVMAGESQCIICGMFYHCLYPKDEHCQKNIEKQKGLTNGVATLNLEVMHPTNSILKSLEKEIRYWCENHNVTIIQLNLNQIR